MSNQLPFISICIPSYNRSVELLRLLRSIDCVKHRSELEIVICEDHSPRREEVRRAVNEFKQETSLEVVYHENGTNLGYDKNLRELVRTARGTWIVFMGDDDVFVPGALDNFFDFLFQHQELGYVLKSHELVHKNGKVEKFRYYPGNTFFNSGVDSYVALFRKSVQNSINCGQFPRSKKSGQAAVDVRPVWKAPESAPQVNKSFILRNRIFFAPEKESGNAKQ